MNSKINTIGLSNHHCISQINSTQTTLSIDMNNNSNHSTETIRNNRLGHLERDRKARTQLDTEILDLYDPIQETTQNNSTEQSIFSSTSSIPRSIETCQH
ncbi:2867_t:CDS:2 [Dentiscutata heterogama]|uniref:2867_t:CDS:1 n=1 Tax=Dentiscutata heterogama TaxID=1316150 RepID=A0ACA9MGQ4_9GLOM|nr:2867_t:CDS:2 [Dentiscutata heterogama]